MYDTIVTLGYFWVVNTVVVFNKIVYIYIDVGVLMLRDYGKNTVVWVVVGCIAIITFFVFHTKPAMRRWYSGQIVDGYISADLSSSRLVLMASMLGTGYSSFMHGHKKFYQGLYAQSLLHRNQKSMDCDDLQKNTICLDALYNQGNALFYLGSGSVQDSKKEEYRKSAIEKYDSVLQYRDDSFAYHNKSYIEKLLKDIEQNQKDDENPFDDGQKKQGKESQKGKTQENQHNQREDSEDSKDSQGSQKKEHSQLGDLDDEGLSPEQRKNIELYQQYILDQQEKNQPFFNKKLFNDQRVNTTDKDR